MENPTIDSLKYLEYPTGNIVCQVWTVTITRTSLTRRDEEKGEEG